MAGIAERAGVLEEEEEGEEEEEEEEEEKEEAKGKVESDINLWCQCEGYSTYYCTYSRTATIIQKIPPPSTATLPCCTYLFLM
jgi:hypothetical protein